MQKIASFTVNHTRLLPGLYVSRQDTTISGDVLTTFDVRMTAPNREPAIDPRALHAMEHLAATFLRNHPRFSGNIVYWGPMGCCTGNYLIWAGDARPADIVPLMKETMKFIIDYEGEIPGASPMECGNYSFMDLNGAKTAAIRYLNVLDNISPEHTNYPD